MKTILDWIRSNLITTISIAVTVIALAVLIWVYTSKGQAFRKELEARGDLIHNLERYSDQTVSFPSSDPNEPPNQFRDQTINDQLITMKKNVNRRMKGQLGKTTALANKFNQSNHSQMIKGMLPRPNNQQKLNADDAYLQAFTQMRSALDAGTPPTHQRIEQVLDRVRAQYARGSNANRNDNRGNPANRRNDRRNRNSSNNAKGDFDLAGLSDNERKRLHDDLQSQLLSTLRKRAKAIHIYAPTAQRTQKGQFSQDFPFDVDAWAYQSGNPAPWQIWEAQLELWIQQDIVRAIAKANHTDQPEANVMNAPVKRLLNIEVIPGYVGLQTAGGVDQGPTGGSANGSSTGSTPRNQASEAQTTPYLPPEGGKTTNANKRLSGNFYVSPTGRVSNGLYDVRHVRLSIIADVEKLPAFFHALAQTNFMTVLDVSVKNVDEHQALREGFVYGPGDAARVDMVIETLWLRDWTTKLMPETTQVYVGAKASTKQERKRAKQRRRNRGQQY